MQHIQRSKVMGLLRSALLCAFLAFSFTPACHGYSVLTHEAIIDTTWKDHIVPVLLQRFPDATPDQLLEAHAYAYGGAIIQDMGYYPFGSHLFSDLAHYVRSGEFIKQLIDTSQDLNDYAFALGALAHYAADNLGHPVATNRAVAIMYPELRRRFGNAVTYEDKPAAHMQVEFSFDVKEVAEGNYAPDAYRSFIGFQVSKQALEKAFLNTYAFDVKSLFLSIDLALGTYRHTVSSLIPEMTKVAWKTHEEDIRKTRPTMTKRKFIYNISRAEYRKTWSGAYSEPGFGARLLAFFFRLLPRFGPFRTLAFRPPTPEVERLFMKSFNDTLDRYKALLARQKAGGLVLPDANFDTGEPVKPGTYRLADEAYAKLLDKLHGKPVPKPLRDDLLKFYADLNAPFASKQNPKEWQKILDELNELKAAPAP